MLRTLAALILTGSLAAPALAQTNSPDLDAPPGFVLPAAPAEGSAEATRAKAPLDAAIEAYAAKADDPDKSDRPTPPQAIRAYVEGREKLLAGNANGAARDFQRAAAMDPSAPAPHEALGEMLLQRGLVAQGIDSYRKAVDAGSTSANVLLDVANADMREGNFAQAAALLVRALSSPQATNASSLARPLILERLQATLAREGWTAASIEAAEQAYTRMAAIDPGTTNAALSAIQASIGNRWIELGDRALSLGRNDDANRFFQLAADADADWTLLTPRRVWSLARKQDLASALDAALPVDNLHRLASGMTVAQLNWLRDRGLDQSLLETRIDQAISIWDDPSPMLSTRLSVGRLAATDSAAPLPSFIHEAIERTPGHRSLMLAATAHASTINELATLVEAHPTSVRALARAWLDHTDRDPTPLESLDPAQPGQALTLAALWLELDRPDLAADALADAPASLTKAQALAGDTRWPEFDSTLSNLEDPLDRVQALVDAMRYAEARHLVEGLPVTTRSRHLRAQIALLQFRAADAAEIFDEALSDDAYDTEAMRGLVAATEPGSPAADPRRFESALAALRLAEPWAPMVIQLDTRRLTQFEGVDAALDFAIRHLDEVPMISGIVAEVSMTGDAEDRQRAIEALTRAHNQRPYHARVLAPLIVLLAQSERADRAQELIDHFVGYGKEVADLAESIEVSRSPDPVQARLVHLGEGPMTVERTLRLAEALVRGDHERSADLVTRALPEGIQLPAAAYASLMRTMLTAGQLAEREASTARARTTLAMIDAADAADVRIAWQIRLVGFSSTMLAKRDDDEAIAESVRALAVSIGDPNDALNLARQYRGQRADVGSTIDQARAEVAYALAGALYFDGLEDASLRTYRIALEFHPDHVWANNDLGYFLTERGESLDEAEKLIERAYELRPDEINILDSLAWLRYRRGQIEDSAGKEGALTLYERALGTEAGRTNDTVQRQAGDVFWKAGQRERAIEAWREALSILDSQLEQAPQGSVIQQRWTEERAQVADRLESAADGSDPLAEAPPD